MGRHRIGLLAGIVGASMSMASLAGCSGAEPTPGSPQPAGSNASANSGTGGPASSTSAAPSSGPNRPKKIDLTGQDACQFGRKLPLAELGFDIGKVSGPSTSGSFPGNTECLFDGIAGGPGLLVTPVTNEGMDSYLPTTADEVTEVEIEGFPGAVVKPLRTRTACFGVVDVAEGQLLSVKVSNAFGPEVPQDKLCASIPRIAAAAVAAAGR